MEMQTQSSKPDPCRMTKSDKLSLEDYLSFFNSHKQIDLTADKLKQTGLTLKKLNQIISMHGFLRFKRIHKNVGVVIDAVKSIDLMEPSRSTLNDENLISSNAVMTLEETITDLKKLNWQECCVTSIQTINSVNYDLLLNTPGAPPPSAGSEPPKRSRKRRTSAILAAARRIGGGTGGSQSVCSSAGSPVDRVDAD